MRSYNLSPDEIVTAITRANLISPSGNMAVAGKYPMVPLNSVVKNIKDLESVPIRTGTYPTVFVRDVGQVVPIALQLGFWFTPIVYAPDIVPQNLRPLLQLNPMTAIVQSFQNVMLFDRPPDFAALAEVYRETSTLRSFTIGCMVRGRSWDLTVRQGFTTGRSTISRAFASPAASAWVRPP